MIIATREPDQDGTIANERTMVKVAYFLFVFFLVTNEIFVFLN